MKYYAIVSKKTGKIETLNGLCIFRTKKEAEECLRFWYIDKNLRKDFLITPITINPYE
jgi:hypothetical protein